MEAQAVIVVTNQEGQRRVPVAGALIIGRDGQCDIQILDAKVSKQHCVIHTHPGSEYTVEDLNSRNGTYLNGQRLAPRESTPFKNRDMLTISGTTLVLECQEAKPSVHDVTIDSSKPASVLAYFDQHEDVQYSQEADPGLLSGVHPASSDPQQFKRAAERLKLLVEVGQAISKAMEPGTLLTVCLDKLLEIFPQAHRGVIMLYNADGSLPEIELQKGPSEEIEPEDEAKSLEIGSQTQGKVTFKFREESNKSEINLSRTIIQRIREQRQSILFTLSAAGSSRSGPGPSLAGITSLMCAPLIAGDKDQGFIQLETNLGRQAFQPEDLNVLTVLAGQVALLIRNTELSFQAAKDAVTRSNLRRFLSPGVADRLLSGQMKAELGGTEKKGTIFYSDIVGFTRMGPHMSPQNIVTLLNRYLKVMQNIIFRRGGSVDKCAGDSIMAFWGVLDDASDASARAVSAAVEMQIAMFEFNRNEALKKEIVLPPVPLGHGIGVNTGIVCAGNIGSDHKIEFTVIGDTVNVTARIESLAGRGQVFIGAKAFAEVKDSAFCFSLPVCPAKNVDLPLQIYSVRAIAPPASTSSRTTQAVGSLQIDDLLFCLPCKIVVNGSVISGMLTGIANDAAGSKFVMQSEFGLEAQSQVSIEFNVPEKPTLPSVRGIVERCTPPPVPAVRTGNDPGASGIAPLARRVTSVFAPQTGRAVTSKTLLPGMLIVSVPILPAELKSWGPGVVLPSDLSHFTQIVRA
jgi:adenylate cyclase